MTYAIAEYLTNRFKEKRSKIMTLPPKGWRNDAFLVRVDATIGIWITGQIGPIINERVLIGWRTP
jgi:hypothetical protein